MEHAIALLVLKQFELVVMLWYLTVLALSHSGANTNCTRVAFANGFSCFPHRDVCGSAVQVCGVRDRAGCWCSNVRCVHLHACTH